MAERLTSIKKTGGGGYSKCIITGTLHLNVNGYNNAGAYMMHSENDSNVTIEINLADGTYTINGQTVQTVRSGWSGTSNPVAQGDCTLTIISISFV